MRCVECGAGLVDEEDMARHRLAVHSRARREEAVETTVEGLTEALLRAEEPVKVQALRAVAEMHGLLKGEEKEATVEEAERAWMAEMERGLVGVEEARVMWERELRSAEVRGELRRAMEVQGE